MHRTGWIFALLLTGIFAGAQDAPSHWKFRTVSVQVLDVEGKPAPGVVVRVVGLDRDAAGGDEPGDNQNWRYTSDAHGRFVARFGEFYSNEYREATNVRVPGWGAFHFVAEKEGTAGAVSPYLKNEGGGYQRFDSLFRDRNNEWRTGSFAPLDLSKQPASLVLQLKRGVTVFGKVTGVDGKPVSGCNVWIHHDLHAWTHTGYGAEIFARKAVTDAQGAYRIEHVYPNVFSMEIGSNTHPFWLKTRLRGGAWIDDRADLLRPAAKEKQVQVDFVAGKDAPYRYFGKVTDSQGKGIAHAKVALGVSLHWPPRTFGDDHHFPATETAEDGSYSIGVESRYVRGFAVEAPGFEREDQWADEGEKDKPFAPGRYNFKLSPKGAAPSP